MDALQARRLLDVCLKVVDLGSEKTANSFSRDAIRYFSQVRSSDILELSREHMKPTRPRAIELLRPAVEVELMLLEGEGLFEVLRQDNPVELEYILAEELKNRVRLETKQIILLITLFASSEVRRGLLWWFVNSCDYNLFQTLVLRRGVLRTSVGGSDGRGHVRELLIADEAIKKALSISTDEDVEKVLTAVERGAVIKREQLPSFFFPLLGTLFPYIL